MKAVILAAGKSTRTYPLTLTKPKPLLKVSNITLIEHNLTQLVDLVDEVIIVIGYKGSMIKKHLGNSFQRIKIKYVEQKQQLGTGHAVQQAEKFIKDERFIVMMADDLYFRGDIRKCLRYDLAVLAKRVEDYGNFGVFTKKGDKVFDLVEKPQEFVSDLANAAFYVFTEKIFESLKKIKKSPRGELELTDALSELAKKNDIFCVEAMMWLPVGYVWNLLDADQVIRDQDAAIGQNSSIKGKVVNCSIGKNCVIEGDVKNCVIGDNVTILAGSLIEDSVIGDNVTFSGTIQTTGNVDVELNGKTITIENFGAAIGDNCTLKDVTIRPGTLVWPKVKKTKKDLKGIVK